MLDSPIGVLGGSFDPIHNGHLHIALTLQYQIPLPIIKFIPCKQSVLKSSTHASTEHRIAMIKTAIAPFANLQLDLREIERDTPSYTIDTLRSLRNELPNTPLCFILGVDAFSDLPKWHRWQEILKVAHLIIVNRPYAKLPNHGVLGEILKYHQHDQISTLQNNLSGGLFVYSLRPMAVSSTKIRQRIIKHQPITKLVPLPVIDYIQTHHLYAHSK